MTRASLSVPLTASLLLALCACSETSLAQRDPHGYAACSAISQGFGAADSRVAARALVTAGEEALQSSTEAIRETTESQIAGLGLADPQALRAACEANGFAVAKPVAKI